MELHPTHLSGAPFFIFAAVIVASALTAVTVADARRQALSFFFFSMALGSLIYLEAGVVPALFVALLGIACVAFFWGKLSSSDKARNKAEVGVAVEEGPNRPVAFFLTLCLAMVLTPIWGHSIWRGHQVEPIAPTGMALWGTLSGANVAWFLAVVALALIIFFTLVNLQKLRPSHSVRLDQSHKLPQNQSSTSSSFDQTTYGDNQS